MPKILLEV